jgi:hypothetical protein
MSYSAMMASELDQPCGEILPQLGMLTRQPDDGPQVVLLVSRVVSASGEHHCVYRYSILPQHPDRIGELGLATLTGFGSPSVKRLTLSSRTK